MDDKTKEMFDEFYSGEDMSFGAEPSDSLKQCVLEHQLGGEALDLGCGDGRNSLFLAGMGFRVTAVDASCVATEKLMQYANGHGLGGNLRVQCIDALDADFPPDKFNLVSAITFFDHIPVEQQKRMVDEIHISMKTDGIMVAQVHMVDDPGNHGDNRHASELQSAIKHYFETDELSHLLEDRFKIISYKEFKEEDHTHGEPHQHSFSTTIVRKT